MKEFIFLIIVLTFIIGCENEHEKQEKFFNPSKLDQLDLANLDGFWDDEVILDTSFNADANFKRHTGFLKGIIIYNGNKSVWISVFTDQETAINAMEIRINDVEAVIETGTSEKIQGRWWFVKNTAVFVNKWNTIIEVVIFGGNNEDVEDILYNTANELARRVDSISR